MARHVKGKTEEWLEVLGWNYVNEHWIKGIESRQRRIWVIKGKSIELGFEPITLLMKKNREITKQSSKNTTQNIGGGKQAFAVDSQFTVTKATNIHKFRRGICKAKTLPDTF